MYLILSKEVVGLMYCTDYKKEQQESGLNNYEQLLYLYLNKEKGRAEATNGFLCNMLPIDTTYLPTSYYVRWKPFELKNNQVAVLDTGKAELIVYKTAHKFDETLTTNVANANQNNTLLELPQQVVEIKHVLCETKTFEKPWFNLDDVLKEHKENLSYRITIDLDKIINIAKSMKFKGNRKYITFEAHDENHSDAVGVHCRTVEEEYPDCIIFPIKTDSIPRLNYTLVEGVYTQKQIKAIEATAKMLESAGTLKEII